MENIETEYEDPYSELGYVQKAVNKGTDRQDHRREKNFALLKELDPSLIDSGQGTVTLKLMGRQIDFHLASDTFYAHAKAEYGYGIAKQVRKMQEFLKGKK